MTTTKLQQAVIAQLGDDESEAMDTLRQVAEHSADAGWPGFAYFSDTCKFFEDNQAEIVGMVKEMADDLGSTPIDLVAGFGCLRNDKGPELTDEIGRCLYGKPAGDDTQVPNALAWFALEEVARQLFDR